MYFKEKPPLVYSEINSRWKVGIIFSPDGGKDVSFVNGICTMDGGTHVEYILRQIKKGIKEEAIEKYWIGNISIRLI